MNNKTKSNWRRVKDRERTEGNMRGKWGKWNPKLKGLIKRSEIL
jgi:hypothetical protein